MQRSGPGARPAARPGMLPLACPDLRVIPVSCRKALPAAAGLATLAAVFLSAANPAAAQGGIIVYGMVDAAVVRESGGAAGAVTKLTSGVAGGSRLGFRGTEELGDGLRAIYLIEAGILADTGASGQGGVLFGRQAYVGLQGGAGMLTAGRQYTSSFLALTHIDPFQAYSMAGTASNLMSTSGLRINNTVRYAMPDWRGFGAEVSYGLGEVNGNSKAGRQIGASASYTAGPTNLRVSHGSANGIPAGTAAMTSAKTTLLGATYDLKTVKFAAAYAVNKGAVTINGGINRDPQAETRDLLLGCTIPYGVHTFRASWIAKQDRKATSRDARQWALGYNYFLSRRTDLYAAYAAIDNHAVAGAAGFYTVGNGSDSGTGDRTLNLGLRHAF